MNAKIRTKRSRAPANFKSNGEKHSRSSLPTAAARADKPATDSHPKLRGRMAATLKRFPIVGVGASAGGLDAFTQLLQNLPVDTGMAFVLVQHLDPDHESALTQLLARTTSMPVTEVTHGTAVGANHI